VLMVSGTDEHGTPILVAAEQEGVPPKELADRYNRMIEEDLVALGLSYDLFTRTTTRNHHKIAQDIFSTLHDNGYVFPKTTMGAISPTTGRTLPDRYIEGTCPICAYPHARGDQCDNCGNQLDPIDLIDPKSRINGETPVFVETEHYFLDLPAFVDTLSTWLKTRTSWRPNVLRFALNLLDDPVVPVGELLRRDALLLGSDQDGRPVLVGARHHQHLVARHPLVAAEDVGRNAEAGDVADVPRTAGIRPGHRGEDVPRRHVVQRSEQPHGPHRSSGCCPATPAVSP